MVLGLSIIRKRNIKKKRIVRKEYGNNTNRVTMIACQ